MAADPSLVIAHSDKQRAAGTYRGIVEFTALLRDHPDTDQKTRNRGTRRPPEATAG